MEFTDKGLELTKREAFDVAEVLDITSHLQRWPFPSKLPELVLEEPKEEDRVEARRLKDQIYDRFRNPDAVIAAKRLRNLTDTADLSSPAARQESYQIHRSIQEYIRYLNGLNDNETYVVNEDDMPTLRSLADLALENSNAVVDSLCTPNVCDGYHREWRPIAYRILTMTAEISVGIDQQM